MSSAVTSHTKLTTVATFPIKYFLENLAVRSDNSLLVSVLSHNVLADIRNGYVSEQAAKDLYGYK